MHSIDHSARLRSEARTILTSLALLSSFAAAQASVTVTFEPPTPVQGEAIRVTLTNHGPEWFVLPTSCLFNAVHANACDTDPLLVPYCLQVITFVPPGTDYSTIWDQRDQNGDYVLPGTYAFDIAGVLCPKVTIVGNCSKPPFYVGEAKPGTAFFEPRLEVSGGMPDTGNAAFALRVEMAVGGAPAMLVIGSGPANLQVGAVSIYVDLAAPHVLLPFTLTGTPGVAGAGTATIPLPVPATPALQGLPIHTQVLIADSGASFGLAHTRGLYFAICPN